MEQAADATACGDCSCWKCLQELKSKNCPYVCASMNEQGYCVSPTGYLSHEEVMQYAEVAKESGQLCDMHQQEEIIGIDSLD